MTKRKAHTASEERNAADERAQLQKELRDLAQRLATESDRGAVLITGSEVDNLLANLLRTACTPKLVPTSSRPPCNSRGDAIQKLLEDPDAPLGTFSSRIRAAFAFGLITDEHYANLEQLRKARNHCAHHVLAVDFSDQKLRAHINNLPMPKVPDDVRELASDPLLRIVGVLAELRRWERIAAPILRRGDTHAALFFMRSLTSD